MKHKVLTASLMIMALVSLPMVATGQAESQPGTAGTIQKIVDLAIQRSPILKLQQSYIGEIEALPQPGEGFIDFKELQAQLADPEGIYLGLPQVVQLENIREMRVKRGETLAEAQITYENLKKSLISQLLGKIISITRLKNRYQGQIQLKSFLDERKASLEKQVKAGVEEPSTLFDLVERIINLSVDIENVAEELNTVRLETALNFGGEWSAEILTLLNELY